MALNILIKNCRMICEVVIPIIFLYKNSLYWAQVVTELSDFVI